MPPPVRALRPEEPKKGATPAVTPQPPPAKQRRGAAAKDVPKPAPICRTVQNLPLDHASMVRMAYEEPPSPGTKGRGRGRNRTSSFSAPSPAHPSLPEEEEDEYELEEREREQRLRLREQLGVSSLLQLASSTGGAPTPDLSVLADVALTLEPEDLGDSEETETSDEAEEHKLEEDDFLFSPRRTPAAPLLQPPMHPEGLLVLTEHNYFKPPAPLPTPSPTAAQRRGSALGKHQEPTLLLLEAPEEVIGEAADPYGQHLDAAELTPTRTPPGPKRKGAAAAAAREAAAAAAAREAELEAAAGKNKKRRRKDSEVSLELTPAKKQKEKETKKQKKRKLEVSWCSWYEAPYWWEA